MTTPTKFVAPGEGAIFDFEVLNPDGSTLDASAWTVTATMRDVLGVAADATLSVGSGPVRQVTVTGTQTAARSGSRQMVKVVGQAPAPAPADAPMVQEYLLIIGSV